VTAADAIERWALTCAAVESVLAQTVLPSEIILVVDHNPDLLRRLRECWQTWDSVAARPRIRVIESVYDGHLGASATTAAEAATTEFIVFLDGDAAADPWRLANILAPLEDPQVNGVGGAPIPAYARARPTWFPHEFNWVFVCALSGAARGASADPPSHRHHDGGSARGSLGHRWHPSG